MQAAVVRPVLLSSLVAAVTFFVGTIGLTTPLPYSGSSGASKGSTTRRRLPG